MKNIRNHIRKAADQHVEHVDNDAILVGIQQKMEEPKKKRRFIPFFLFGGLCFLLIITAGLYFNYDNSTDSSLHPGSKKTIIDTANFQQNSNSPHNSQNQNTFTNRTIGEQIKTDKTDVTIFKTDNSTIATGSGVSLSTDIVKNQNNSVSSKLLSPILNSEILSNQNPITFLNTSKGQKKDLYVQRLISMNKIPSLSLFVSNQFPKIHIPFDVSVPAANSRQKEVSGFNSLTFYSQYGIGSKSIYGDSYFADIRNDSEQVMEQVRFGVESDFLQIFDITLYGGISYASINYRVNNNETYFEDRKITYLYSCEIGADGSKIENYVTEDQPYQINIKSVRHNSHRLISIPLGLHFGRDFSNLNVGIRFGLDLNYSLSDSHTVVGPSGRLMDISVGKTWEKPSLHTAISLNYPLFDRWYIHSKLIYRNFSIENYFPDAKLSDNYSIYGLDLGLRMEF